jgi:putative flavoprotein involved in K+ transport
MTPTNSTNPSASPAATRSPTGPSQERYDVVVIGGGQAGLATGYFLKRTGLKFLILDASARIGDVWRRRWDSLRLFTPAKLDGLAGMRFPAPRESFPTKDEMADYLEAYAARFELPVRTGTRVNRLSRSGEGYRIETDRGAIEAAQVVVAMASYQTPRVPAFARELRGDIVQLHAKDYRNPAQLRDGGVLIAGAGNSGAEIALEVARQHEVWLAGRDTGHVPFRIDGFAARWFLTRLVLRVAFHRVLTVRTPIGRKVRPKVLSQGGALIRVKPAELEAAAIHRAPRVIGVRDGLPLLDDGRSLDVANVVWCTGFAAGFDWIDLPIFKMGTLGGFPNPPAMGSGGGPASAPRVDPHAVGHGEPEHEAGVVPEAPGLYFVGLHFLYAFSSTMIHGVSRDAKRIARAVASRAAQAATAAAPRARPAAALQSS